MIRPIYYVAAALLAASTALAAERPNVVWIVSEDNSIHYLDHFFKGGAKAPNIESLAAHGLTFDHAFSNAPVCSVARTTLATSCYGPRIGTQYHRKYRMAPMPVGLRMFPAYLREAGYYTTNNSKKDYNAVEGKGVWDESSKRATWRNRPDKNQPFFHMESHGQSHESSLHFKRATFDTQKTTIDPASIRLADYHPDTPLFRFTHAYYLDRMRAIDGIVGQTVAKLKEDGLLENTFVFYFGDHGGVLPRSKGYIYESGLHVPLVVRVPDQFKQLVDAERGTRVGGFVSFVDFGPTVLNLAGVRVPDQVDGHTFLGKGISIKDVNARDEAFGYADRFDEKYDFVRSLRKGKYQYIRNFQPYLPDGLNNNYRYKCLAFKQWRDLFNAGKLKGPAKQFFEPRAVEQLFDCEADPHQVRDLADDPKHAETLIELRTKLQAKMKHICDLSMYPESYMLTHAMSNPVAYGQRHKREIGKLIDTANLAVLPFENAKPGIEAALESRNSMIRYWGTIACTSFGQQAASLADDVLPLLKDDTEAVRIRAAEFLGLVDRADPRTTLTDVINSTKNPVVATEALNSVVWFRDFFDDRFSVKPSDFRPISKGDGVTRRLDYIRGMPYPEKGSRKKRQKRKQTLPETRAASVLIES